MPVRGCERRRARSRRRAGGYDPSVTCPLRDGCHASCAAAIVGFRDRVMFLGFGRYGRSRRGDRKRNGAGVYFDMALAGAILVRHDRGSRLKRNLRRGLRRSAGLRAGTTPEHRGCAQQRNARE